MINLEKLVRPNILKLKPYTSARDDYQGEQGVFLDANENPFGTLNRYPDPYQKELKKKLAGLKKISPEHIFIGNGSDEVIDLAFRIFCNPALDKALTFTPTYGMYEVSASINNIELLKIPLNNDFQIDLEKTKPFLKKSEVKLLFICSPNNPTGNLIDKNTIEFILKNFNGIVILDEAYIDFSAENSLINLIEQYQNLLVCQTFSKAWGLAAARVGVAYANPAIIKFYNNVKPPYNVSEINQHAAINALDKILDVKENIKLLLSEKKRIIKELKKLKVVKRIFSSDANFFLVEVENANTIYTYLISKKIIVRNRNNLINNCLRITVGTPKENTILLNALKNTS